MSNFKISLLFILIIILTTSSIVLANDNKIKTIEGIITTGGSAPLRSVILDEGTKRFSIKGKEAKQLMKLEGAKVKLTAYVNESEKLNTEANLEVIKFNILDPGFDQRPWITGKLLNFNSEAYILTDEQIIYEIRNIEALNINDCKEQFIVAAGIINQHKKYEAEIIVESYKVF